MKKYTPLDGLRWSRDSDSALNNMPQTDVLGRAGGRVIKKPPACLNSRLTYHLNTKHLS